MRLGFTGQAGSGKDTAARMALKVMPSHPIYSLAGPIKDVFDEAFGWDERHREGKLKETRLGSFIICPLQLIRITAKRYKVSQVLAGAAVWKFLEVLKIHNVRVTKYNIATYKIDNLSPRIAYQVWGSDVWRELGGENFWTNLAPEDCIIADVRFDNEAFFCDLLFKVEGKNQRTGSAVNQHISEAGVNPESIDHTIENTGTLDDLQRKVVDALYCFGVQD
ncbi:deoxynucleoside monophosphate kinase [Vibrio phage 526E57-1]